MRDYTFRELDIELGLSKGSSFRAFKQAAPALIEGRDFRVLHANTDAEAIHTLRSAGRIYGSSVNVVLLSAAAAARLRTTIQAAATAV